MPTNIWLGTSIPNSKVVKVTPGPNIGAIQPPPEIKIGLGKTFLLFTGWNAESIAAAWTASSDPFLAEITALVSGDSIVFTGTEGEDFEITCSQADTVNHPSSTYQLLTFNPIPTSGNFTLTVAGSTTGAITFSATPATLASNIQTAVNAMTGFSAGDVTVTAQAITGTFLLDFSTGRFVGTNVALVTATHTSLVGGDATVTVTTLSNGNVGTNHVSTIAFPAAGTHTASVGEVQTLDSTVLSGTFTITLAGYGTTIPLAYTAGRSAIQSALEDIVGIGNIIVTGGPLYYATDNTFHTVTMTYAGTLLGVNMPTASITATGNGVISEIQRLRMTGSPTSGTFTMTYSGQTTGALNWNATAAQVQTALIALSNIGPSDIVCSGGPLVGATPVGPQTQYPISSGECVGHANTVLTDPLSLYAYDPGDLNVAEIYLVIQPPDGVSVANLTLSRNDYTFHAHDLLISVLEDDNGTIPSNGAEYAADSFWATTVTVTAPANNDLPLGSITANIATLIAHIQARASWVSGNKVVLKISMAAVNTDQVGFYGISTVYAPSLAVTYLTGGYPIEIFFQGTLAGADQPLMTLTPTGCAPAITTVQNGASAAYSVATTTTGGTATINNISGGTFSLVINGTVVSGIPYNASAANVVTAINTVFGSTVVSATGGPAPGTAIVLTFIGVLQKTPITLQILNSLTTNFAGSVERSVIQSGVVPATGLNVWDLTVCPGEGTLGLDDASTYCRIVLTITNNLPFLLSPTFQTPVGQVEFPLSGINALIIESAINEALGSDACRVVRIGHSQEWANVKVPAVPTGSGTSGAPAQWTNFWYFKDTYRITFVNQWVPSGTTSLTASFPLIGGVPALPSTWMQNDAGILNPTSSDPLDFFIEANRVIIGFMLMETAGTPLHIASVVKSGVVTQSKVTYRVKLLTQFLEGATINHTGIAAHVEGTIRFDWCRRTIAADLSHTDEILLSTAELDWNSPDYLIEAALEDMFFGAGNVHVTGSLYNSWLSESLTDAPTNYYQDLKVSIVGDLAGLPVDESEFILVCTAVSGQFSTSTAFQKNFTIDSDYASRTLPPFTCRRERITVTGATGSITFGVGPYQTTLPVTSTAADVQTALDGFYPFAATSEEYFPQKLLHPVVVYGETFADGPMDFEFTSFGFQQDNTSTIEISSNPTGIILSTVVTTTQGVLLSDENQLVSIVGAPHAGTYTIAWSGNTTGAIAYNADLTTFTAALAAATPSAISLTGVTGDIANGYILNWAAAGGNRAQAVAVASFSNAGLSAEITNYGGLNSIFEVLEVTKGRGPNYYDDYNNWSLQRVPNEDAVVVDDGTSPIKYGLDQSSTFSIQTLSSSQSGFSWNRRRQVFDEGQVVEFVLSAGGTAPTGLVAGTHYIIINAKADGTFNLTTTSGVNVGCTTAGIGQFTLAATNLTLAVHQRFAGSQIGLTHLRSNVGGVTNSFAPEYLPNYLRAMLSSIDIGIGVGDGLTIGRFDPMSEACAIHVFQTAESDVDNIPAVLFLCNNAATTLRIDNGSVGLAVYADETSVIGPVDNANGDLLLYNSTVTSVIKGSAASVLYHNTTVLQPIS